MLRPAPAIFAAMRALSTPSSIGASNKSESHIPVETPCSQLEEGMDKEESR